MAQAFDVLVVGGGIAGIHAALTLANALAGWKCGVSGIDLSEYHEPQ